MESGTESLDSTRSRIVHRFGNRISMMGTQYVVLDDLHLHTPQEDPAGCAELQNRDIPPEPIDWELLKTDINREWHRSVSA